jgi:hypothetical protein
MKSIMSFLIVAATALSMPAMAAPVKSTPSMELQSPCREMVSKNRNSCIVVSKIIPGNRPTQTITIDPAYIKAAAGKAGDFAVVYALKSKPYRGYSSVGVTVTNGRSGVVTDLPANTPTLFWISTRNGGRTWSSVKTTDMDSAITY